MAAREALLPHRSLPGATASLPGRADEPLWVRRLAAAQQCLLLRLLRRTPLVAAFYGLALATAALPVRAQNPSPNQPMAIEGLPPPPCPLLVPHGDAALQPLRIQPSQVARKNAVGCLSPADAALYGPDGCPRKLCHAPQGTVPLPQL